MTNPAFVEIDVEKLSRDELVMLGMKECMDAWLAEYQAVRAGAPAMAQGFLDTIIERMAKRRDGVAVALTRSVVRHGSGRLNNIKAEV